MELTLCTPFPRYVPPLYCHGAALVHFDFLSSHDLVIWTDCFVSLPFDKEDFGVLAKCSLCCTKNILFSLTGPLWLSFELKPAPFCKLSAGLDSTKTSATSLPSPLLILLFCSCYIFLSSAFHFISHSLADLVETILFLIFLFYPATMGLRASFLPGNTTASERLHKMRCWSHLQSYEISLFLPLISNLFFSRIDIYCFIKILSHIDPLSIHLETCAFSSRLLCPVSSSL